ncbi:MAG: GNAT family N-acetyltransferase [Firmicutes bacterium]|nr:GNAT family N-acetyltransferase [Bacillota bacterium]
MFFETKDLIIRPSVWADLEYFDVWERDPAVTEFFSIRDGQTMEECAKKFIADEEDLAAQQFTICWKKDTPEGVVDGEPIGRIVLADIIEGWKAELWRIYIADKSLRGKGLGKQAMKGIMGYCFEILDLERMYLDHYTGNPASHMYLSLGFQYEGVLRKNCRKNGILYDVHLMSMLRGEYEALAKDDE